ncbi:MAG TPA: PaaI family thioesterase [Solimonas sp.]
MTETDFHKLLMQRFAEFTPHVAECGMRIVALDRDGADAELPYRDDWLGDIERGVIHTGIVTTLVDSACGAAVLAAIGHIEAIATIDLRMDYLRASRRGLSLQCRAECHRLTDQVAFARAQVWQDDPAVPVATAVGAFMRSPAKRSQFKSAAEGKA